ncbi:MAG: SurA N-terminal domain-containing protein [Bacteroidales bacterium]|nr:SurA N-terminal domain-containing protein [Bacteroidales bacterium]
MAVLEKIRVKFGLAASIIIALGLLSFIIDPSELLSAVNNMSSKNDVGEIAGKAIPYTDFSESADKYSRISEIVSGTSSHTEQEQEQIRNSAWQSFIDKYLFIKNAKAAGINVGDDEVVNLTTGDMVSPIISQQPLFYDESGKFSPERVSQFVQNIATDQTGDLKLFWNWLQTSVYTEAFYDKYFSLFSASNFQTPLMKNRLVEESNTTNDVDFVMVPIPFERDTTIVVTKDEIRDYYKNHKDFFRQSASRDIEYVVFEVKPSDADIAAAEAGMNEAYEEFKATDNLKTFLSRNSESSYSTYWYKAGDLVPVNKEIDEFVFGNNPAGTSPIYTANNVYYAARVMDTKMIPDSAYVRHILLQGEGVDKIADSLVTVLAKGENFTNLVSEYSADKNSAYDGELGCIGWLTQNYMIPGFESVITANTGKPFVLKTQYGTHVVEVVKKTAPIQKKQVAILSKTALASKETFNDYYSQANRLATLSAGKLENYKKAVDSLGVYSHTMPGITEATSSYGAIDHAKEVTRWAFDNKPGKVSNIITVDNNYFFVVAVDGAHKEGIAPLQEVATNISDRLYADKASVKNAERVAEKIAGLTDLETIADTLHTTISNIPALTFSSLQGQTTDPRFAGAVSVAPLNEVCGPVPGIVGAYVFRVNGRDTGTFFTEEDAKNMADRYQTYDTQMLLPVMMQDADVKDNRARFF